MSRFCNKAQDHLATCVDIEPARILTAEIKPIAMTYLASQGNKKNICALEEKKKKKKKKK